MIETFRIDTFSEGDILKVFYGDNEFVEMVFTRAFAGRYKIPGIEREPFSWIFKTEKRIFIESGCYTMEQEKVGQFEMMITPVVSPIGEELYNFYEAVFS